MNSSATCKRGIVKNMASTTEMSVAHFCDLANSEADVFYQDAGDFSRRLDAEVLCT